MNKRIDIMVDIETLGRKAEAPITQISAVKFDITDGHVYSAINLPIDVTTCTTIEGGTLLWWLQTDATLLQKLIEDGQSSGMSEKDAIRKFCDWAMAQTGEMLFTPHKTDVFLWGNGILFDNRLIQAKCQQYGIEYPIFYRNDRDMRTLVELAAIKTGCNNEFEYRSHFDTVGTRHNALDDCLFQVKVLTKAYNDVMGTGSRNITPQQVVSSIVMSYDEYAEIVNTMTPYIIVHVDNEGLWYEHEEGQPFSEDELKIWLAQYFGVSEVTTIHIDDTDLVGVWISYKA